MIAKTSLEVILGLWLGADSPPLAVALYLSIDDLAGRSQCQLSLDGEPTTFLVSASTSRLDLT